jgi:hypothetical protein
VLESTVIVAIYIYFVSVVKQYELMIREEDDDVKEEVKGDNGLSFEN